VSISEISPTSVLHAIRHGKTTRADLAAHFEVLPSSLFLTDAIGTLIAHDEIRVELDGSFTPHDLLENLPHDSEERQ
jgi:hypothetical protein